MIFRPGQLLYQGKTKDVYRWDKFLLLFYFNDNILGFSNSGPDPGGNEVVGKNPQKGIFNLFLSSKIFAGLSDCGLLNHYFFLLNEREALFWKTKRIPIEFVWRNFSAGRFYRENPEYGWLKPMKQKIFYYLKDDRLGDPPITRPHLLINHLTISRINFLISRLNKYLTKLFSYYNLVLVDFKTEFGWRNNQLLIIDELSTDTMRFTRKGKNKILNWMEVKKILG